MHLAKLRGRWRSTLETVDRLYEFKPLSGGVVVSVSDSADGELFVVRNQRASQCAIRFDLTAPSSGTTTKNRIAIEKSEPICFITYQETWVRKSAPRELIRTPTDKETFLGEWTEKNDEVSIGLRFKPYGRGVRIEVEDRISGKKLKVRNPRWAGSTVSFHCGDSNGLSESWHKFSVSGVRKACHIITLKDHLRHVGVQR